MAITITPAAPHSTLKYLDGKVPGGTAASGDPLANPKLGPTKFGRECLATVLHSPGLDFDLDLECSTVSTLCSTKLVAQARVVCLPTELTATKSIKTTRWSKVPPAPAPQPSANCQSVWLSTRSSVTLHFYDGNGNGACICGPPARISCWPTATLTPTPTWPCCAGAKVLRTGHWYG